MRHLHPELWIIHRNLAPDPTYLLGLEVFDIERHLGLDPNTARLDDYKAAVLIMLGRPNNWNGYPAQLIESDLDELVISTDGRHGKTRKIIHPDWLEVRELIHFIDPPVRQTDDDIIRA